MAKVNEEVVVTAETLEDSLSDLLKSTDITGVREKLGTLLSGEGDLNKGGVEHSGHYTEGGSKGGGIADSGDAGGLDSMMIGKLVAAGIDSNTAASFAAFMVAKAEGEEEEEEEMEGYQKSESFADTFQKSEDLKEYIDASPYMAGMTEKTIEALDEMGDRLAKSDARSTMVFSKMAKALHQTGTLVKSQAAVIAELGARLGIVERTPMPAKGVSDVAALNKSMPGEATHGGDGTTATPAASLGPLSKGEMARAMSYMRFEKGVEQFGGEGATFAISRVESVGEMSKAAREEVNDFLTNNPGEVAAARNYQ